MTPKEKALDLANKFVKRSVFEMTTNELLEERKRAKSAALNCVNEILKEHCHDSEYKNPIAQDKWIEFWLAVRSELENL